MIGIRALRTATPALGRRGFQSSTVRRDVGGIGEKGLQGAADNAFNRERAAVKEHAGATSGA